MIKLLKAYGDGLDWLDRYSVALGARIRHYRAAELQDDTEASIRDLQTQLRAERDVLSRFLETLKRITEADAYAACRRLVERMPEGERPILPYPETAGEACGLIEAEVGRLQRMADFLDRWPRVNTRAFTRWLLLVQRGLADSHVFILGAFACIDEADEVSFERFRPILDTAPFLEAETDGENPVPRDAGTPDILEDSFISTAGQNDRTDDFNVEETYRELVKALKSAGHQIRMSLESHPAGTPVKSEPFWQSFFDWLELGELIQCLGDAQRACESCYDHLDLFQSWLAAAIDCGVCLPLEPSPESFLRNAIIELGSARDTLIAVSETDDDQGLEPDAIDPDDDELERRFIDAMDRYYRELYGIPVDVDDEEQLGGNGKPMPSEWHVARFEERLADIRDNIEWLLHVLCVS